MTRVHIYARCRCHQTQPNGWHQRSTRGVARIARGPEHGEEGRLSARLQILPPRLALVPGTPCASHTTPVPTWKTDRQVSLDDCILHQL